jgi:hypothetical protein
MDLESSATSPPELIACPQPDCLAPAQVVDRFTLASTDGPVDHVKTMCLAGHGFTPTADMLAGWPVAEAPRALGTGG